MKYLTQEELEKLSPERLRALHKSLKAKVGKYIDHYFDFEPDMLTPEQAKLNDYRKTVRRLMNKKGTSH